MHIGDYVISQLYPEKGKGRILRINSICGNFIFEIFFEGSKEVLSLNDKNIEKIQDYKEIIDEKIYDKPILFSIRLLSEKIDSLFYQNKIISASNFSIIPLPHQVLTVNNVLNMSTLRCLIADEVGLGKTIEAALIFEELKLRKIVKRILIVAPSGLTTQWKDEFKTKFNEDFILINNESFKSLQEVHGEKNVWKNYDKIITSIDFLKPQPLNDEVSNKTFQRRLWHNEFITDNCIMSEWDMVIFDEAHKLSKSYEGAETARYKLGKQLADVSPILLLLTATPHQGDSAKFKNLLKLIDPYKFYAPDSLNPKNVQSVTVKNNKRAAVDFEGNIIFKKRFPQMVKISMDKEGIEKKLYEAVTEYVTEYYDLAKDEGNFSKMFLLIIFQRMVSSSSQAIFKSLKKRLYYLKKDFKLVNHFKNKNIENLYELNAQEILDQLLQVQEKNLEKTKGNFKIKPYLEKEIDILENCVSLAQKTSQGRQDSKMKKLLEIIDVVTFEENNPQTKFIIFTEFIETQNYIGEVLKNMGYSISLFNGRMNLQEKIKSKSEFQDECQFLITTDSGGEGINLQFCHVIINYDLPWNPMKIEQRIGRIDRIGQTQDVKIFNFVLDGTVEERVRSVLDSKLNLIAEEFGDDKRQDVLSAISDENNFDTIYIDAVMNNKLKDKDLEKIGASIYTQAKEILSEDDLLVPFTKKENNNKIKSYMVKNESDLIKNLIIIYAKSKNITINEYAKKKDVFYFSDYLDGVKFKNIVFDRDKAIENEQYEYLNFNHPFVRQIVLNNIENNFLLFNLEYNGYSQDISGTLFYYKLELTNNEGFIKRKIVPIFVNENGYYDINVSNWFNNLNDFNFKMGNIKYDNDIEYLLSNVTPIIDDEMLNFKSNVELELLEKLNTDKDKYDKYYKDKEFAIKNIGIENIRNKKLENLRNQRINEMNKFLRKRNLVPKINLFLVAKIKLFKGD